MKARAVTLAQARDGLDPVLADHMRATCDVEVVATATTGGLVVDRRDGEPFSDAELATLNSFMTGYVAGLNVGRKPFGMASTGERFQQPESSSATHIA